MKSSNLESSDASAWEWLMKVCASFCVAKPKVILLVPKLNDLYGKSFGCEISKRILHMFIIVIASMGAACRSNVMCGSKAILFLCNSH